MTTDMILINKLIMNMKKMYDLIFGQIIVLEVYGKQSTKEYRNLLKRLDLYEIKEGRILSNLSGDMYYAEALWDSLENNDDLSNEEKYFISLRLYNLLTVYDALNDDWYDEEEKKEEIDKNKIGDHLYLSFLLESYDPDIFRTILNKYIVGFIRPSLGSDFIIHEYDVDDLQVDEINEEYLDEILVEISVTTLTHLFESDKEYNANTILNDVDFLLYLYEQMDTETLLDTLSDIEMRPNVVLPAVSDGKTAADLLISGIETILDTRDDSVSIETMLDSTDYDKIFELFSYSKKIVNLLHRLCILECKGQNDEYQRIIDQLLNLCHKEKEASKKIDINGYNKQDYLDIFEDMVSIYDQNNLVEKGRLSFKAKALSERLMRLFPVLVYDDTGEYVSGEVESITESLNQHALIQYQSYIKGKKYVIEKYRDIMTKPYLSYSFVLARGDVSSMLQMDDSVSASMLGITVEEYVFDKENILYGEAETIVSLFVGKSKVSTGFDTLNMVRLEIALKQMGMYNLDLFFSSYDTDRLLDEDFVLPEEVERMIEIYRPIDLEVKVKKSVNKNVKF